MNPQLQPKKLYQKQEASAKQAETQAGSLKTLDEEHKKAGQQQLPEWKHLLC